MMDEDHWDGRYRDRNDISLNDALRVVSPMIINSILSRHPSLLLCIAAADVGVQVYNQHKNKRKFGDLVLLKDF